MTECSRLAFTTARLHACWLDKTDWPYYCALQQNPAVMRFIRDIESEVAIAVRFQQQLASTDLQRSYSLWLSDGRFAGLAGFWLDEDQHKAELGFILVPELQGQGVGRELVKALIAEAWAEPTVHKLVATVTAGNEGSRRVLVNNGFVQEGCLRQHYWLAGRWHDDWVFGLLRSEAAPSSTASTVAD